MIVYTMSTVTCSCYRAPMPYIIGVPEPMMDKVRRMDLEDAVILNVDDKGSIVESHDDRSFLSSDSVGVP